MAERGPGGQPVVRMMTYIGTEFEGSWLNVADFLEHLEWLIVESPEDAPVLRRLIDSHVAGVVQRSDGEVRET